MRGINLLSLLNEDGTGELRPFRCVSLTGSVIPCGERLDILTVALCRTEVILSPRLLFSSDILLAPFFQDLFTECFLFPINPLNIFDIVLRFFVVDEWCATGFSFSGT